MASIGKDAKMWLDELGAKLIEKTQILNQDFSRTKVEVKPFNVAMQQVLSGLFLLEKFWRNYCNCVPYIYLKDI